MTADQNRSDPKRNRHHTVPGSPALGQGALRTSEVFQGPHVLGKCMLVSLSQYWVVQDLYRCPYRICTPDAYAVHHVQQQGSRAALGLINSDVSGSGKHSWYERRSTLDEHGAYFSKQEGYFKEPSTSLCNVSIDRNVCLRDLEGLFNSPAAAGVLLRGAALCSLGI